MEVRNTQNITSTESMNLQVDPLIIGWIRKIHIPEKRKDGGNERGAAYAFHLFFAKLMPPL
ncbi:hypothetical protein A2U01_0055053 [Trifolium medium]|uniref:Uncharacterized protein n=1 Tax=Trifolium medium TaxID=97028 RepID=A0A392RE19_9FABA|nr:hypothetical protein [Trifolium medium]